MGMDQAGTVCESIIMMFSILIFRNKYEDVRLKIKNIFDFEYPCNPFESFLEEVPIQRKYNVKLPARKQLDKLKMIRKSDRCVVCKKGVLQGRLVQCHYCIRLYHLNCLDPPIRDWDHSMRWICPAHDDFFELAYPDIFTPGCGLLGTKSITTKRNRCELPSLPVDKFFNIPSKIDKMYKKPQENVPTTSTENSSLNILCDVATLALESMNADHKTNEADNVPFDISNKLCQERNSLPSKQCSATLSCLSVPLNISVQREVLTIGKSHKNKLCLQPYGNCEYISDYHATIRFDKKTGDFILKNLSRFGVIVDNVSYFGNRRKPSNNHELKKVNSGLLKHINKQRKTVQKDKIIHVAHNSDDEKPIIKYAAKTHGFNYKPMSKYYLNMYKNTKHGYKKAQCKCSKRLIQKDGYSGFAILRNESIILIGCMKFKFTYDSNLPDSLETFSKIQNKPFQNENEPQENGINILIDTINNLSSFNINEERYSLKDADITNPCVSETIMHDNNDTQPLEMNASETSDNEYLKQWDIMNAMSSKQSCFASDLIQEVEVNESSADDEIIEEEIVYEMNYVEADNCAPSHDQEWEIEEIVIGEDRNYNDNELGNSTDVQLKSTVEGEPSCNREDYKTEHMYCARSKLYDDTIVISDDDDNDNNQTDDNGYVED
ncbi:uncharacterized protein LOC111028574 isoform X3 [Myzus persicae]|uniref:uncharacterized protein LOC111028574 isoform X3 n=1 Tax=Myzus persicae TaxID=13164 RepID=UPI000B9377F3|nr:uncharacterized protein LOC111028574 isoform X3 [Myzus persicae]